MSLSSNKDYAVSKWHQHICNIRFGAMRKGKPIEKLTQLKLFFYNYFREKFSVELESFLPISLWPVETSDQKGIKTEPSMATSVKRNQIKKLNWIDVNSQVNNANYHEPLVVFHRYMDPKLRARTPNAWCLLHIRPIAVRSMFYFLASQMIL